jgi:putative transposase
MTIKEELLDELLKNYKKPEDMLGENGILKQLTKALLERALQGEMNHHLGYTKNDAAGDNTGNSRNGKSKKILKGDLGVMPLEVPRDRNGTFEPQIVQKGQSRFDGFDDKILSLYSRGMTTREIQGHLNDMYGVDVSPDLISHVTDAVLEEVREWQNRPLDTLYPILYLDAIRVKCRDDGHVQNKALYLAIGVTMDGQKDVLGMWVSQNEGAKFWLSVVTELKTRGVEDILIACVDGLKGFPEAIETVFPKTQVQLCIVHMIRNSLAFVSYRDRKVLVKDLKTIYQAVSAKDAEAALGVFETAWQSRYPTIAKSWRERWVNVIPFFGFPPDIRKAIYTTNAIESTNMSIRKIIKNRGLFPNEEAMTKLVYLALRNIKKKWTMPIRDWGPALNQFAIIFGNRVPLN